MRFFLLLVTSLSFNSLFASKNVYEAKMSAIDSKIEKKDYKGAIKDYTLLESQFPNHRAQCLIKKAECYAYDQEIERALQTFTLALEATPKNEANHSQSLIYSKALEAYLNPLPQDKAQKAKQIQFEFLPYYEEHPKDYPLGYLLALSYAMQGNYGKFIDLFYENYLKGSSHYLADRTLGMVYLKLMKFSGDEKEKKQYRDRAKIHFSKALNENPKDALLFRLTYLLTPPEEKSHLLENNLKLLIEKDAKLLRVDLFPYVRESIAYGHIELTEQLINKAKTWYPVSRSLDEAEKYYLDQKNKLKDLNEEL